MSHAGNVSKQLHTSSNFLSLPSRPIVLVFCTVNSMAKFSVSTSAGC